MPTHSIIYLAIRQVLLTEFNNVKNKNDSILLKETNKKTVLLFIKHYTV